MAGDKLPFLVLYVGKSMDCMERLLCHVEWNCSGITRVLHPIRGISGLVRFPKSRKTSVNMTCHFEHRLQRSNSNKFISMHNLVLSVDNRVGIPWI